MLDVPTDLGKELSIYQLSLIPGTHSALATALIAPTFGGTSGSAILKYGP